MCLSNLPEEISSYQDAAVSILVLMDVPLEYRDSMCTVRFLLVSILVLMDVPLE